VLHAQAKHLSKDQAKVLKAVEQDMKHSTGGTTPVSVGGVKVSHTINEWE